MRRKDREIKDKAAIEDIIGKAQVCRVAMVDGSRPYIIPLCFGYRNGVLYFHGALNGKKVALLRSNCMVCFEFDLSGGPIEADRACDWSMQFISVIGFGKAYFVQDHEEKRFAMNLIMKQYKGEHCPVSENVLKATLVFKVEIESMTGKQCMFGGG